MESGRTVHTKQTSAVPELDYRRLFESAPGLFVVVLADEPAFTIVAASDAYLLETKQSLEEIAGRSLLEVLAREQNPADIATFQNLRASLERVLATRQADSLGFEARSGSMVNSPVLGRDGELQFIIHRVEEGRSASEQSLERRDAFLLRLDDATRPLTDPNEITGTAARLLGEYLQVSRCAYADVEPDEDTFNLTGDYNRGVSSIVERYTFRQFGAPCLQLMREGKVFVVEDAEADARVEDTVEPYRLARIRAIICVPLLKASRFVAAMAVQQTTPRAWKKQEIELVRMVANRCWESIERVHVTRELREREQRFRFLAESIPQMVWTATPDGMLDYVNCRGSAYFGIPQAALLGTGWLTGVHPEDQAQAVERWKLSLGTGEHYEATFRLLRGDDKAWRWHLVRALPLLGAGGGVVQWFGTCTDMEDQKQAAGQIEDDRRRWRDLLFHAPAAIAVLRGPEHTFEWVNEEYVHLMGRPTEALVGKTVIEAVPEIAEQSYINLLDAVYQTGKPFTGHESLLRLERGDGTRKDVYLNFVCLPSRDVAGQIDGIFVHAIDVTGMVLARKQVEESERQFRTLAETIPNLAWKAHADGHIFWYNRRWYEYTGTTLEETAGWGWQKVHDPTVLPQVLERWNASLAKGEPFEMVFPLKGADGTFRSFLTRIEPVKDKEGRVVRWFGSNTDITAQRQTEEQLRRMNRELEEFAYVASHDLQEPLRMVNIYTHLILRSIGDADGDLGQYCSFVREGVGRMEALIRDLLTFSRSVHTEEIPAGRADLSASLAEAITVLKNRIEESGATITAESLPVVRGETGQLAHVFQNVLSNALKYRKKEIAPEIRISAELNSGQWVITTSDNGIGFEPRYAERIFGLFKRLHNDEYPGTGLGLAICKRIVERYGGRMWAEGQPGNGATFRFSLPHPEAQ